MTQRYLICTLEEYNQGIADEVKLDVTVKKHSPIYSADKTEVLVKGIGNLTPAEVKEYQANSEAWQYEDEI